MSYVRTSISIGYLAPSNIHSPIQYLYTVKQTNRPISEIAKESKSKLGQNSNKEKIINGTTAQDPQTINIDRLYIFVAI